MLRGAIFSRGKKSKKFAKNSKKTSQDFNYFDTSRVYLGGQSETALRDCLTSRYPRESFVFANKLSTSCFKKEEEIEPLFEAQLKSCGLEYFDFYLMHAQSREIFEKYRACRAYEKAMQFKKEGRIRHLCMSFHDKAEVLDDILTAYPEVEAVQIQLNYLDFEDPAVQSGVKFLPMYLPVLLGGCLLGIRWGVAVGALSPLVSFLITSAAGSPMTALARLPFMSAELLIFAAVAGAFSKKIAKNALWAFPAVISAQIVGRAAFLALVAIFQSVSPFTPALVWGQIVSGVTGLILQAIFAPLIVIALKALLDKKSD